MESIGFRFHASVNFFWRRRNRLFQRFTSEAEMLIADDPEITEDRLRRLLVEAATLQPIDIGSVHLLSVTVERADILCGGNKVSGHLASATIPYTGSGEQFRAPGHAPSRMFNSGRVGARSFKLQRVTQSRDLGTFHDWVIADLAFIADATCDQVERVAAWNVQVEERAREWLLDNQGQMKRMREAALRLQCQCDSGNCPAHRSLRPRRS